MVFLKRLIPRDVCFPIVLVFASLSSCRDIQREIPEKIEVREVIASSSSGFFMEGCTSAIFTISKGTADLVNQQGAAFFQHIDPPRYENPSNPYSFWMETPLRDAERSNVHAVRAIGGCGAEGDFLSGEIERALKEPGNFYTLTRNKEGMILVAPRARIATFLYFG